MEIVDWYLQWHITNVCQNNCRHCYNRTKLQEQTTLEDFKGIVKDLLEACKEFDARPRIGLIGGDPLLHPHFKHFVEFLKENSETVIQAAGNPETLTDEMIDWLKPRLKTFQLSLDGLEKTHDWFRQRGSFQRTITSIRKASERGLKINVMTTISEYNIDEAVDVMRLAYGCGADKWLFARYVPPVGTKLNISPKRFRQLMEDTKAEYERLGKQVITKEAFWYPMLHEPLPNPDCCLMHGCGLGTTSFAILPDNTLMGCRRHEGSVLGKWEKRGDILDIFVNSPVMNKLRQVETIQRCKDCQFLYHCRGCPAVAYAIRGSYTDSDPQCSFFNGKEKELCLRRKFTNDSEVNPVNRAANVAVQSKL